MPSYFLVFRHFLPNAVRSGSRVTSFSPNFCWTVFSSFIHLFWVEFLLEKNRLAINWMLIGPFHSYVYGSNQHEKIKFEYYENEGPWKRANILPLEFLFSRFGRRFRLKSSSSSFQCSTSSLAFSRRFQMDRWGRKGSAFGWNKTFRENETKKDWMDFVPLWRALLFLPYRRAASVSAWLFSGWAVDAHRFFCQRTILGNFFFFPSWNKKMFLLNPLERERFICPLTFVLLLIRITLKKMIISLN